MSDGSPSWVNKLFLAGYVVSDQCSCILYIGVPWNILTYAPGGFRMIIWVSEAVMSSLCSFLSLAHMFHLYTLHWAELATGADEIGRGTVGI